MPEIPGGLPLPGDEAIKLDHKYEILDAELFTSEVQGFKGVRVTLQGGKDDYVALALWQRPTMGRTSKLGSFMVALGTDTDKWLGRKIQFISWTDKKREVEVV